MKKIWVGLFVATMALVPVIGMAQGTPPAADVAGQVGVKVGEVRAIYDEAKALLQKAQDALKEAVANEAKAKDAKNKEEMAKAAKAVKDANNLIAKLTKSVDKLKILAERAEQALKKNDLVMADKLAKMAKGEKDTIQKNLRPSTVDGLPTSIPVGASNISTPADPNPTVTPTPPTSGQGTTTSPSSSAPSSRPPVAPTPTPVGKRG